MPKSVYVKHNGHSIGIIMKELVRRALVAIQDERYVFEVTNKDGYGGKTMADVFTTADTKAQAIYLKSLREIFPRYGIIAEEKSLVIKAKKGVDYYFTIDALDGTRAFIRRQSHGVGTMIALVRKSTQEIVAVYIGDVNTGEIYGYRPDSMTIHRISKYSQSEHLTPGDWSKKEGKSIILLRDPLNKHSKRLRGALKRFDEYQIDGGSIGTWMARLWKREVAAVAIGKSGHETPWDTTPIYGITAKLDYVFLIPDDEGGPKAWKIHEPKPTQVVVEREFEMLVVPRTEAHRFLAAK